MVRLCYTFDRRVFIVLLLLAASAFGYINHCIRYQPFMATVVSVADGDTITVEKADGEHAKIRFYGIDAPELHQPYGDSSRRFADKILYQKQVEIIPKDFDKYSRIVALVKVDACIANEEIVGAGLAWWYQRYAPDYRELREREETARRQSLGLWSDTRPIPPWEWRKQRMGHKESR